jgi:multisubunit Na+/H+ antiporter MnhG subunit
MSAHELTVDLLLALGVAAELACCAGLLRARNALDRLHYSGAATTVGPVLLGAAILVEESVSAAGIVTVVVVGLLVALSPALTIATARAARPRWRDRRLALAEEEKGA